MSISNRTSYKALNGSISRIPIGKNVVGTESQNSNAKAREIILLVLNHITQENDLGPYWILEGNLPLGGEEDKSRIVFFQVFLQITQDILRRDIQVSFRDILDYHWETWITLISEIEKIKHSKATKGILSETLMTLIGALSEKDARLKFSKKTQLIQFLKTLHQIYFQQDYPSVVYLGPAPNTVGNPGNFLKNLSSG